MATTFLPLLTLADVQALPDDDNKYELIEGELFVSRAQHFNHNSAILNLALQLKIYLKRNPIGEVFVEPGVIFGDYDAVIPHLAFFSNERFEAHAREGEFYAPPIWRLKSPRPKLKTSDAIGTFNADSTRSRAGRILDR